MSDRTRRFHPLLVGAIGGLAFGDLLLGLNLQTLGAFSALRLLSGGALCGLVVGVPLAFVRPRLDRPSRGAWILLALLAAGFALFVESQRLSFYSFLGNGARRVLVATLLSLSAAAAVAIVSAVVQPGPESSLRTLLALLALFLLVPLSGRPVPDRAKLGMPPQVPRAATRSLLVVGLEGISWDLLVAGASDGSLPVLARLLRDGAGGPLVSQAPYDRAALWATVATGKRPAKHGVVSGVVWETLAGDLAIFPRFPGAAAPERLPFSRAREMPGPRRSRTFWEILAVRGHQAAILGWPEGKTNEEKMIDSELPVWATRSTASALPSPADRARLFHVDVRQLDRLLVKALLPEGLSEAERARAHPLEGAAHDLWVVGATLGSLPTGLNNVSALVLSGLANPARVFGPAAQPSRYWGSPPRNGDVRTRALRAYYRFLDETLGDLVEREGKDRTICLFSPVGYGPPPPLQAITEFLKGREPEASAEASADGFLVLCGSGIRSGVRLTSAVAADIAPTLLVLAGEPIARDIDGRVLSEAFDERFSSSASIPIVTTFEAEGPQ
ncbi:MAG: alkaline phosphatase family protein [Thermoanaerobaculia bacterium]